LEENRGTIDAALTTGDLREIESAFSKFKVQGARLPEEHLALGNR